MADPWDIPPIPTHGDDDKNATYAGVGRVTSAWEGIELQLSRIYTFFVGDLDAKEPMDEYGSGTIFRNRIAILDRAAEKYFIKNCCQHSEWLYELLRKHIVGYSDRRNEAAHGIVFNVRNLPHFQYHFSPNCRGRDQFLLIPPLYDAKKHDGGAHKPRYAYRSVDLIRLESAFHEVQISASAYINGLIGAQRRRLSRS